MAITERTYSAGYTPVKPRKHTCRWCGGTFVATCYPHYCSDVCRKLAKKEYVRLRCIKLRRERKQKPPRKKDCEHCGAQFEPKSNAKYCSDECKKAVMKRQNRESAIRNRGGIRRSEWPTDPCVVCGNDFERTNPRQHSCSPECSAANERARNFRKRAIKSNGFAKHGKFDPIEILERDGWKCYICGTDTPKELRGTFVDNAPEVDHIHPLSRGGEHSPKNVACACRRCNGAKAAKAAKAAKQGNNNGKPRTAN